MPNLTERDIRGGVHRAKIFYLSRKENSKSKIACARALLRMPDSKGGRVSREIQISVALAGSHFLLIRSIRFSRRSARVTITHFTGTLNREFLQAGIN